ncbi:MAG: transcription termination/antitermination protein NusG, partial [Pseudonocardiales bacterium]|nr:transcription termination/antitermination protein NusG [Pseudonocardiales bacterium]
MSEYDAAGDNAVSDETSAVFRSESAEAADEGPADLAAAARLLGAGEDLPPAADNDEDGDGDVTLGATDHAPVSAEPVESVDELAAVNGAGPATAEAVADATDAADTDTAETDTAGTDTAETDAAETDAAGTDAAEAAAADTDAADNPAAAAEEPAEDEDPVETLRRELRTQFGDWYVVHSYAGYENKV